MIYVQQEAISDWFRFKIFDKTSLTAIAIVKFQTIYLVFLTGYWNCPKHYRFQKQCLTCIRYSRHNKKSLFHDRCTYIYSENFLQTQLTVKNGLRWLANRSKFKTLPLVMCHLSIFNNKYTDIQRPWKDDFVMLTISYAFETPDLPLELHTVRHSSRDISFRLWWPHCYFRLSAIAAIT